MKNFLEIAPISNKSVFISKFNAHLYGVVPRVVIHEALEINLIFFLSTFTLMFLIAFNFFNIGVIRTL